MVLFSLFVLVQPIDGDRMFKKDVSRFRIFCS